MSVITEDVCNEIGNVKNLLEVILIGMKKGDAVTVTRRDEDYEVKLEGDREG